MNPLDTSHDEQYNHTFLTCLHLRVFFYLQELLENSELTASYEQFSGGRGDSRQEHQRILLLR